MCTFKTSKKLLWALKLQYCFHNLKFDLQFILIRLLKPIQLPLLLSGNRNRSTVRKRTSSVCRRNSESCSNYDINRSQTSLHKAMSRRQLSLTSEPDSNEICKFNCVIIEFRPPSSSLLISVTSVKSVVAPVKSRNLLLQFHAEYTSITDELESVCHMLASPTSSSGPEKTKNLNEMTNREFAELIEKQHLRECEDNDYIMLKRLLVARESLDETDDSFEALSMDMTQKRILKRDIAIELPVTPSKSNTHSLGAGDENEQHRDTVPFNRNQSADRAYTRFNSSQNFLNPTANTVDPKMIRKSVDSLQKNSSTDTEYSMQPYKVIKQSSNETNTSMTGSFNVENSSFTNETDMDTTLNQTVIENVVKPEVKAVLEASAVNRGAAFLRKQFSTEKSHRIDSEPAQPFSSNQELIEEDAAEKGDGENSRK